MLRVLRITAFSLATASAAMPSEPGDLLVPIRVTIDHRTFEMAFGMEEGATEGFDRGVDGLTAPPPRIAPYAFLGIDAFPHFLTKDVRPPGAEAVWMLRVMDTRGRPVRVAWEAPGETGEYALILDHEIDMRKTRGLTVMGDRDFVIRYYENAEASPASLMDFEILHSGGIGGGAAFRIRLVRPEEVTVDIWDRRGRVVRRWRTGARPGTVYRFRWDGRDDDGSPASPGVYVVRLRTGSYVFTKKIVL